MMRFNNLMTAGLILIAAVLIIFSIIPVNNTEEGQGDVAGQASEIVSEQVSQAPQQGYEAKPGLWECRDDESWHFFDDGWYKAESCTFGCNDGTGQCNPECTSDNDCVDNAVHCYERIGCCVECLEDADCDDRNPETTIICTNRGSCESYCKEI